MARQGSESGKLDPGSSRSWEEGTYTNLSVNWYGSPGSGVVKVSLNGKHGVSYTVPSHNIPAAGHGVFFNMTDRSITYTLSDNTISDNTP